MRDMKTSHQQLAEQVALQRLGYPLNEWIYDQRQAGIAWRTIADQLTDKTDGMLSMSFETLRTWYGEA